VRALILTALAAAAHGTCAFAPTELRTRIVVDLDCAGMSAEEAERELVEPVEAAVDKLRPAHIWSEIRPGFATVTAEVEPGPIDVFALQNRWGKAIPREAGIAVYVETPATRTYWVFAPLGAPRLGPALEGALLPGDRVTACGESGRIARARPQDPTDVLNAIEQFDRVEPIDEISRVLLDVRMDERPTCPAATSDGGDAVFEVRTRSWVARLAIEEVARERETPLTVREAPQLVALDLASAAQPGEAVAAAMATVRETPGIAFAAAREPAPDRLELLVWPVPGANPTDALAAAYAHVPGSRVASYPGGGEIEALVDDLDPPDRAFQHALNVAKARAKFDGEDPSDVLECEDCETDYAFVALEVPGVEPDVAAIAARLVRGPTRVAVALGDDAELIPLLLELAPDQRIARAKMGHRRERRRIDREDGERVLRVWSRGPDSRGRLADAFPMAELRPRVTSP
jgi:hypothetical protein